MASRFAKSEAARTGAPMRARTLAPSRTFRWTVTAALILGAAADHDPAAAGPA
jgi:hypothetical protein